MNFAFNAGSWNKRSLHNFLRNEGFISVLKKNNNDKIFSLGWNIVYLLLKSHCFDFLWVENTVFFEPKNWWTYDSYWLLKNSYFELFGNWKYSLFFRQKVNEKMIFTDYWNVLVLNFLGMENRVFFEAKSSWKDDIYWLLKSFCFELFCDEKCGLFRSKELMGRWYLLINEKFLFWATEKFLFWTFRWWEIRSFLAIKLM